MEQLLQFEDLVEDVRSEIFNDLDLMSRIMFALTNKTYHHLLFFRRRKAELQKLLSEDIGNFGSETTLLWFADQKWTFTFELIARETIRGRNSGLFFKFETMMHPGHIAQISYRRLNFRCMMMPTQVSMYLGESGDQQFIDLFASKGFEVRPLQLCEGAALKGHLGLIERYWTDRINSTTGYFPILLAATRGGHINVLKWAMPRNQNKALINSTLMLDFPMGTKYSSAFLELLTLFFESGSDLPSFHARATSILYRAAVKYRSLHAVKYLEEKHSISHLRNEYNNPSIQFLVEECLQNQDFDIALYLLQQNKPIFFAAHSILVFETIFFMNFVEGNQPRVHGKVVDGKIFAETLRRKSKDLFQVMDILVARGFVPGKELLKNWNPTDLYRFINLDTFAQLLQWLSKNGVEIPDKFPGLFSK